MDHLRVPDTQEIHTLVALFAYFADCRYRVGGDIGAVSTVVPGLTGNKPFGSPEYDAPCDGATEIELVETATRLDPFLSYTIRKASEVFLSTQVYPLRVILPRRSRIWRGRSW